MKNLTLLHNTILAEQDEKGLWVYKTNPDNQLKGIFKKGDILKQRYHDLPNFPVIVEAENKLVENYKTGLIESVKEMASILNSFGY